MMKTTQSTQNKGILMITYLARCGRGGGGEGWCGTAFGWCTPPVWSLRCDGWTTAGGAVGRGGVWCGFKCGRHWRRLPVHVERLLRGSPRGKHGRRLTGLTPEETVLLVITWYTERLHSSLYTLTKLMTHWQLIL